MKTGEKVYLNGALILNLIKALQLLDLVLQWHSRGKNVFSSLAATGENMSIKIKVSTREITVNFQPKIIKIPCTVRSKNASIVSTEVHYKIGISLAKSTGLHSHTQQTSSYHRR